MKLTKHVLNIKFKRIGKYHIKLQPNIKKNQIDIKHADALIDLLNNPISLLFRINILYSI